jgi:hypothetical protein
VNSAVAHAARAEDEDLHDGRFPDDRCQFFAPGKNFGSKSIFELR